MADVPNIGEKGGEPGSGMDCLQLRQQPGPFHYLISEQAKSLVALQELQHEVGALLEFRDLVIETFPSLRTKMAASASTPPTMTSSTSALTSSNIPIAVRRDWEPGIRVRRKITSKEDRVKKADSVVQDSGFSTETSSKETHSAGSSTAVVTAGGEAEDELWNLLDVIHRKGTRLKDEVEALQGALRDQGSAREESDFQRVLFHASADDVRQLRRERDLLLDRVAEMEAEVLAGRVHTSRLQEDLENLLTTKQDLEEQLRAVVSQRGEVNSRIHDLHLQFVSKDNSGDGDRLKRSDAASKNEVSSQRTPDDLVTVSRVLLDDVLGDSIPKVRLPDSKKLEAILKEYDPIVLQRHLLTSTVQNQVLHLQLETSARLEMGLVNKLDKAREENDELRFQLEDKNIELEGTRARVRMLETLQKPPNGKSPDIIPAVDSTERSEITTASMKAMSPFPINLGLDHSSSTESAHDQAESARRGSSESTTPRRKPSKIPLVKSYAAPKPPGGKHSPGPCSRSRSGESPGRPHSAQSWRNNRSEGNSLSGSKSNTSLSKSRNGSLTAAKDSLTGKLRSVESLTKIKDVSVGSFTGRSTLLRKGSSAGSGVRRNGSVRDSPDSKVDSVAPRRKSQSHWILSSYSSDYDQYPDSLDARTSSSTTTTTNATRHTTSTFVWNIGGDQFYDSIDSNLTSGMYHTNGEDLAECDSLEKRLSSDVSDRK